MIEERNHIYYGRKIGEPDSLEEIVYESYMELTGEQRLKLEMLLEPRGMKVTRHWEYKGEAPDFAGTVQI